MAETETKQIESLSDAEQLIELRKLIFGGVGVIARERARQVQEKGYTPEHTSRDALQKRER